MIVDSSAIVAVIESEPERDRCVDHLLIAPARRISAANLLETYMRVDRSGADRADKLVDEFLSQFAVQIDSVTPAHVRLAREAFRRYGRGSGHPARLNFGDCFAYALSRATGEPLLFVGDDFGQTDIEPAIARRSPTA